MTNKEIGELRRRMKPDRTNLTAVYGCYVASSGEVLSTFREPFGLMAEEDKEKYLAIFRRALSGTPDKNLIDLSFTTKQVADSNEHRLLMRLRETALDDAEARQKLFQTIILDRNRKKYQLQEKQLKDTEKRDRYKVYGELIHTYGYGLAEGAKELEALNYYTNEMIKIPLDPMLDAKANAQKYFDKYNKLKRTYEALTDLTAETRAEIEHLESIATSLDIALTEDDLVQIKEELIEYGYIRRKRTDKKAKSKSKPFHYRSSDGYDIYVGKNNYQNEELTFKFATGNDWWFHAKGMPGSHVIVKSGNDELPDRVFEEAGRLAGYYSKGRDNDKIEIDYLQKKNVKKPNGSAPGFVVYYTNYSLTIHPDISGLTLIE